MLLAAGLFFLFENKQRETGQIEVFYRYWRLPVYVFMMPFSLLLLSAQFRRGKFFNYPINTRVNHTEDSEDASKDSAN